MNTLTEQAQRIAGHIQQPMTETELSDYLASDNYNSELALQHLMISFTAQNKMNEGRKIDEAFLTEMMKRGEKAWKDVPDATAWVEELRNGTLDESKPLTNNAPQPLINQGK
jgi:hypothetical protein